MTYICSIAIIRIDFDEHDPDSYRGISIIDTDRKIEAFMINTGNPAKDYDTATQFAHMISPFVMCSSSIVDYVQDGGTLDISKEATNAKG